MGPICGYAGDKSKEKAEKMLSASRYRGIKEMWQTPGIAIAQISSSLELQGIACDGRFYDIDVTALKKVHSFLDLKNFLLKANGDYALALAAAGKLLLARDPVGARALYYGFDAEGLAFASEKAMLRALNIEDVKALTPGSILVNGEKLVEFRGEILFRRENLIKSKTDAINMLRSTLERAIKIRLKALSNKNLGILFSGGVDSSTLASKIPAAGLYVAGIRGSHDLQQARLSAGALEAEGRLRVIEIDQTELEEKVPEIIDILETTNPMDVELGITLYFATRAMRKDGIEVAISGQGSDELFAGYTKYAAILSESGEEALQNELWDSIRNIASENLERDTAISSANSIEIVMPYVDVNIVKIALNLDPKLKIRASENAKGYTVKYVLRKLAEEFIPREIAWKDKKAMQYGSGMHAALKAIASKNGFTGSLRVKRYLTSIAIKE